jgi:Leucine-rich repeat (LRR) protein
VSGLGALTNLTTIDLSYNRISTVTGLSCCPNLSSVNLSRNALQGADGVQHLLECKALVSLDLTHNRLAGEEVRSRTRTRARTRKVQIRLDMHTIDIYDDAFLSTR